MARSSGRRWLLAGGAGALLLAATAAVPAGADSPLGNYAAVATATGARATFVVPGEFAVEEIVDAGGPLAQSRLGPGTADGFASFPYPGGTAVAYQGLLNVATGLSSPFAYPFYVSAAQPGQPSQELTDPSGAYALEAAAAAGSSTATARLRPGAPDSLLAGTEATTTVVAGDSSVTSTASSLAEALTFGKGVLSIGSVASRSVTKLTGGEAPATQTDLTVSGLRVGDKRIGVGPGGFELLGTPVPVPAADVAKLIDTTLAPAGLQLRFVAPQPVTGGAQAAAIEVVSKQAPPNAPASIVTIRLGGALSAITRGEGSAELPGLGSLPAGPDTGGTDAAEPSAASAPAPVAGSDVAASNLPAGNASSGSGIGGAGHGFAALPAGSSPAPASEPVLGSVTGPAADQATLAAPAPAAALAAQPIVSPRRVRSLSLVYAVIAALAFSALVGAGSWALRGGWPA